MGKKNKEKNNKVKLILNDDNDISRIFVTMLYNSQRSTSEKVDELTRELLQTLLHQVPMDLIHQISNDEQTLALIEHWDLTHVALKDLLSEYITKDVLKTAPSSAHPKDIKAVITGRIKEAMLQASMRATESMRRSLLQADELQSVPHKKMVVVRMDTF